VIVCVKLILITQQTLTFLLWLWHYLLYTYLDVHIPPPGFKWRGIWKEQLKTHRPELLNELKFNLTDGVYTDMRWRRPKVLDDNEFDSINALTDPVVRANRLYELIETRSPKTMQTLLELLKNYPRHETLAAELEELYNESVKLYKKLDAERYYHAPILQTSPTLAETRGEQ
jgi:hypothetical protein